ncbi:MAG: ribonuclease E/G [Lachnospiraceae bacterium]|nr:ribonuclease E/G [Lachnospiraceae bacterium]
METRIVYKKKNAIVSAALTDNRLRDIRIAGPEGELTPGDIYVGRIESVVPGINGAFVSIGRDRNCFLKLERAIYPIASPKHADDKLHAGDVILVQVERDEGRNKPATVVTDFSLTGILLVLIHGKREVRISSKIEDGAWKSDMRSTVADWIDGEYALMLRTNSYKVDLETIRAEYETLRKTYEILLNGAETRAIGTRLFSGLPDYLCDLRDSGLDTVNRILTEDEDVYNAVMDFANRFRPDCVNVVELRNKSVYPLEAEFGMRAKLGELTSRRVWLRSGAYLVFDTTEAMTVVDVNTGKASASKACSGGFLSVNLEAAEELAYQIRLRNLSGIIIVDFIDMDSENDRRELMQKLKALMETDPVRTRVVDMTKLNLVEITRMKKHRPLEEDVRKYSVL